MTRAKNILWGGSALLGAAAAAPIVGVWRAHHATAGLLKALDEETRAQHRYAADHVADLPEPVCRYFHRTLRNGQPLIRAASLTQEGEFAVAPGPEGWRHMRAHERVSIDPIGFVWDARIDSGPLVHTYVRDAYIHGMASTRGDLFGLYPVVNQSRARELSAGALTRFLAEAVWFPTALLPDHGVTWTSLDEYTAGASLTDHGASVSAEFRFDEAGDLVEIFAPDRFRAVDGRYERTPWIVRCDEHEEHGGMRIPMRCEVAWQLPDGPFPYWRARLRTVAYEFER